MTDRLDKAIPKSVIGLIPAAGQATRIGLLPCSKELYPVGFTHDSGGLPVRSKTVCQYLLEKMQRAGITTAYVILRQGKFDIPTYLNDGQIVNMHLAYLMMGLPFGVPFTLDQAYQFVKQSNVALGFPDIVFDSDDAFIHLIQRLNTRDADVILGLFPTDTPQKADMIEFGDDFRVQQIIVKPAATNLKLSWGIAVWRPTFTSFMHSYLPSLIKSQTVLSEVFLGQVLQAAISSGFRVEGIQISDKPFLDIGTPDDLLRALRLSVT